MKKNKLKQRIRLFSLWVGILFLFALQGTTSFAESKMKIVGYIPDYDTEQISETINFDQLTDVNYFSLVPDSAGSISFTGSGSEERLKALVKAAHGKNVRVGISIGGWGLSESFAEATSEANRATFIANISTYVKTYKLDTVDIDWEYPALEEADQFESFIKELKAALGKVQLSICVPTGVGSNGVATSSWENHFTSDALNAADWVNIMSYDAQVEGAPNHSPRSLHKANLIYWNKVMGGNSMSKLVGGVPFYGKAESGAVLTYYSLVGKGGRVPTTDEVTIEDQLYHFNNKKTLQGKVIDTIELKAGGLMIWTPTQDASVKSSSRLMDSIIKTFKDNNQALDRSTGLAPKKHEEEKNGSKIVLALLSISFLALAFISLSGRVLLPDFIKIRGMKEKKLRQRLGLAAFVLAVILGFLIFLPLYLVLIGITILGGLVYWLMKRL